MVTPPLRDIAAADRALARAAARGDREAFGRLVAETQRAVYGLCYRMLGSRDAAADAAQEAYARAFAALASFDPSQKFEVWLLRIARNHCLDQLRHRRIAPGDEESAADDLPASEVAADERIAGGQTAQGLEEALERLPARDREVIALYHLQEKSTQEVAEIVGAPPGTVMARLFRARAKLRAMLKEDA